MAKKKKESAPAEESVDNSVKEKVEKPAKKVDAATPVEPAPAVETEKKVAEKRPPQMVTVNGDKVSHAYIFKSKQSDDWFFTAKINGVPLKAQRITPEDTEAVLNKTKKPIELMSTYYPTKLEPKRPAEDFKIPTSIMTPQGEQTVYKFNVYKEKDMQSYDYGKYRFYAQIGDQKMSMPAEKKDLDAYFDKTQTPKELITKVFGEKLHLADYYKQFQLPEGANIEAKDIRVMKNTATNRYEVSANLGAAGNIPAREISYEDRQSFFSYKTATKEQLAAKYLGNDISTALAAAPKKEMVKQPSLGI